MRIAIGIESLTGGGAERIVRQLAVGLAQRGHRTFVYCLKSARIDPAELIAAGVTIRQARSEGFDPGLIARLAQWTRRDRVDVINAQSSAAACFLLPAAKWCGVPILHTRQGVLLGRPTRYRRCAERLASWFDAIGVVTPALLDSLRPGRARRNAVWLPNCVDRPRLDAEPSRRLLETLAGRQLGAPIVLAVGTICPEKDPIGLLRAFARLRDEIRSARLVWIGPTRDIAYRADVHAMERALGLEGWVHWLGEVENAWRVMAGADVFCLPSRTEGMPVVVVEAMSQAAPIVATAVGGVGATGDDGDRQAYLIRDGCTGWLVPPADPDGLADALLSAVTNRDEARRRAEAAAAEYRRRLTADAMLAQYEAAFKGVVERRRGRPASVRSGGPRRPCVLMVGPGGDQVGGMVTAVDNLCGAGKSRLPYEAVRWVTPRRSRPRRGDRPSLIRSIARHCADLWGFTRALYLHRPDIVHLHTCSHFSFYRDLVQLVLARAARKPVVLHIHGSQFPEFCASAPRRVRRLIRRACEAADTVIVLSEY
ncbi:MAG: glycosyltransferase, partial [Planctomycetota bacterium]